MIFLCVNYFMYMIKTFMDIIIFKSLTNNNNIFEWNEKNG